MAIVRIETAAILDWASFHQVCSEAFGFPDFYGRNLDAFIDCLSYLRDADGMSRFDLAKDEYLDLEINDSQDFQHRLPEISEAMLDCVAFINKRYLQRFSVERIDIAAMFKPTQNICGSYLLHCFC